MDLDRKNTLLVLFVCADKHGQMQILYPNSSTIKEKHKNLQWSSVKKKKGNLKF